MKKIVFLLANVLLSASIYGQASCKVLSDNAHQTVIDIQVGALRQIPVETPNGIEVKISVDHGTPLLQKGNPDLPKLVYSVMIPNQSNSEVSVIESDFTDYTSIAVAPGKGRISRPINPSSIPYTYGPVYQQNDFFPAQLAELNTPYIMRDFRGQCVVIHPVQYNPVTKTLRVYSHIKLKVSYQGTSTVNTLPQQNPPGTVVEEYNEIYKNHYINYKTTGMRYTPLTETGSLLILCPDAFKNEMIPFIEWKEQKGIKTYLVIVDTLTGGITQSSIKNIAKWYYQNKQIAYMLIVGDDTNIPPVTTLTSVAGPSDHAYAYINGNDHYPEFIVGRFSGQSISQISTQVKRTLNYEQTPNTTGNWMSTQIGIASEFGTGDDNQFDFEHIHEIVDSNKNQYVYQNNVEMYDDTCSGVVSCLLGTDQAGNPNATMLTDAINQGASLINYCGHGGPDGIVTTNFESTNISGLNNFNMLPFFFVVGCSPGDFVGYNCFAENMQRAKTVSYEPYGTISNFMSSINQYWDEPMQAQDEFNGLVRGARQGNKKSRLGALCADACMSMIDQYSAASDPLAGSDMADTWIFFGDPTVSLFTKNEGNLNITYDTHIQLNSTTYVVHCPVDGATIGLYYQGTYLASTTSAGGEAYFTFPAVTVLDTIMITATKQNYTPAFGKTIVVNWPNLLNDQSLNHSIKLYPNPANDYVQLNTTDQSTIQSIHLMDASGRTLSNIKLNNSSSYQINTSLLASGFYLIKVSTDKGIVTKSFTKK